MIEIEILHVYEILPFLKRVMITTILVINAKTTTTMTTIIIIKVVLSFSSSGYAYQHVNKKN
jgi:hypothetical protein